MTLRQAGLFRYGVVKVLPNSKPAALMAGSFYVHTNVQMNEEAPGIP